MTRSVIDVIEESLGVGLDADFIDGLDKRPVEDLLNLKESYDAFASSTPDPDPPAGEFWPVSHDLIPLNRFERGQASADQAVKNAMSQLVFAHGTVVPDQLGYLLTRAVSPRYIEGAKPQWETSDSARAGLGNYLEAIAFLRPMLDAGLVRLRPRAVDARYHPDYGFHTDDFAYFLESEFSAVEFLVGPGARIEVEEGWKRASERRLAQDTIPVDYNDLRVMTLAFQRLFEKLIEQLAGFPGALNLESREERRAFTWLADRQRSGPSPHPETENLVIAGQVVIPGLSDLQPTDVVALHESDAWLEYRLGLRRGLERVRGIGDLSRSEAVGVVREEMAAIERSVATTTKGSRFVEARLGAGRSIAIGAAVATGSAPLIGASDAAVNLATGSAAVAAALLWSWLDSRGDSRDQASARCFGALG